MRHPARSIPYDHLLGQLQDRIARGLVTVSYQDSLALLTYSRQCVYERAWDDITVLARGLILDLSKREVVATPFPKFFNVYEREQTIPALPFETFEKVDGSLAIIFHYDDEWRVATKGSFFSVQAIEATAWLNDRETAYLDKRTTYLAEWVAPHNKIVVPYSETALVFLSSYDGEGNESPHDHIAEIARLLGTRASNRHQFLSVADLMLHAETLPPTEEGYVLRFSDGLRLKVKGAEYRRIHALISKITPLSMWAALEAGDDLEAVRRQLPEEFWGDFDGITGALKIQASALTARVAEAARSVNTLSDREVGLKLSEFPEDVRRFIFPYRKKPDALRTLIYKAIRPTGNVLPGYVPSYAINRAQEESI